MPLPHWCQQRLLYGPSAFESYEKGETFDIEDSCPLSDAKGFVIERQIGILACVLGLFLLRSPYAILWIVVPFVVLAFNRVLRTWTRTHISQEILEIEPAVADRDSTRAVISEPAAIWLEAAVSHILPESVLHRVAKAVRSLTVTAFSPLFQQATAGFVVSVSQVVGCDDNFSAAVATAKPACSYTLPFCWRDYLKSFEALSCKVKFTRHAFSVTESVTIGPAGTCIPAGLLF